MQAAFRSPAVLGREAFSLHVINEVTEIEKYHRNFNSYSCAIMVIIKVIKFKLLKSKEQLLGKCKENHGNTRLQKKVSEEIIEEV